MGVYSAGLIQCRRSMPVRTRGRPGAGGIKVCGEASRERTRAVTRAPMVAPDVSVGRNRGHADPAEKQASQRKVATLSASTRSVSQSYRTDVS
jgi:hypothetical protein